MLDDTGDTIIEAWARESIVAETEAFLPGLRQEPILRSRAGGRPLCDPAAAKQPAHSMFWTTRRRIGEKGC